MKTPFITLALIYCSISAFSIKKNDNIEKMIAFEKQRIIYNQKIEKIENKNLQKMMRSWSNEVFRKEFDCLQKEIEPEHSKYVIDPEILLTNYQTFEELTQNYIKGIVVTIRDQADYRFGMLINEPFTYPFEIKSKWRETLFNNNQELPIIRDYNPYQTPKADSIRIIQVAPLCIDVYYPSINNKIAPTKLLASFEAEIPSRFHKFKFTKTDIQKTQTIAGISVTLLNLQNSYAEIKVQTPNSESFDKNKQYNWLKVVATDTRNKFIADVTNCSIVNDTLYKDLFYKLINQKEYTNEFAEMFKKECIQKRKDEARLYDMNNKNIHYQYSKFNGIINEITVIVYDYRDSKRIKIDNEYPITDIRSYYRDEKIPSFTSMGSAFDNRISAILKEDYETKETEINNRIEITQAPQYDEKKSVIKFKYPEVLSSEILYNANRFSNLKEITFYNDKHNPIIIPADSIGYECKNNPTLMVDFNHAIIKYDAKRFPEVPCYAKGVLGIPSAKIEKRTYTKENLPADFQINGSVLTVTRIFKPNQPAYPIDSYKILVKDSTQNYLKVLRESDAYYSNSKPSFQKIYFYLGTPQTIEIYKIVEAKEVDYQFDIKLTRHVYSTFLPFK